MSGKEKPPAGGSRPRATGIKQRSQSITDTRFRFDWLEAVLQDLELSNQAKAFAVWVFLHFIWEKSFGFGSNVDIGTDLGWSVASVRRARRELETSGWLVVYQPTRNSPPHFRPLFNDARVAEQEEKRATHRAGLERVEQQRKQASSSPKGASAGSQNCNPPGSQICDPGEEEEGLQNCDPETDVGSQICDPEEGVQNCDPMGHKSASVRVTDLRPNSLKCIPESLLSEEVVTHGAREAKEMAVPREENRGAAEMILMRLLGSDDLNRGSVIAGAMGRMFDEYLDTLVKQGLTGDERAEFLAAGFRAMPARGRAA